MAPTNPNDEPAELDEVVADADAADAGESFAAEAGEDAQEDAAPADEPKKKGGK